MCITLPGSSRSFVLLKRTHVFFQQALWKQSLAGENLCWPGESGHRALPYAAQPTHKLQCKRHARVQVIPVFFDRGAEGGLKAALDDICAAAEDAARAGTGCIILSDRTDAMDEARVPVPMLLAVGAVHHRLIRAGLRSDTSVVAEAAQCVSTHHVALLVGYGAHAVCPYLAFETCRQWRAAKRTQALIKSGRLPDISPRAAQRNYKKALEKGVSKILSKMGISLLSCYHGAQIFEAYGLGAEVVDTAFRGSVSRIGGLTFADVQAEAESFWAKGFPDKALSKLQARFSLLTACACLLLARLRRFCR